MTMLEWEGRYCLQVQEMDNHHFQLMELINNLQASLEEARAKVSVQCALQDLLDYSRYHFEKEEFYMQRCAYAELAGQQREHQAFIEQVLRFQAAFQAGNRLKAEEILGFLRLWFSHHITALDQGYAALFQAQELGGNAKRE